MRTCTQHILQSCQKSKDLVEVSCTAGSACTLTPLEASTVVADQGKHTVNQSGQRTASHMKLCGNSFVLMILKAHAQSITCPIYSVTGGSAKGAGKCEQPDQHQPRPAAALRIFSHGVCQPAHRVRRAPGTGAQGALGPCALCVPCCQWLPGAALQLPTPAFELQLCITAGLCSALRHHPWSMLQSACTRLIPSSATHSAPCSWLWVTHVSSIGYLH